MECKNAHICAWQRLRVQHNSQAEPDEPVLIPKNKGEKKDNEKDDDKKGFCRWVFCGNNRGFGIDGGQII